MLLRPTPRVWAIVALGTTVALAVFFSTVVETVVGLCGRDLQGLVIEPSHHLGLTLYREHSATRSLEIRDASVDFRWVGRRPRLARVHVGYLAIRDQSRATILASATLDRVRAASARRTNLDVPDLSIDELEYQPSASSEPIVVRGLRITGLSTAPDGLRADTIVFDGPFSRAVDGDPVDVRLILSPAVFADVKEAIVWTLRLDKSHLALDPGSLREIEDRIRNQP